MKKKRLITSALPYVNNIPHLGNLIQVLSADVFARFCRLYGYETLYVCGTDEYGTATETRALEEGVSPKELCDRYFTIHDEIYKWFNISFDRFGRTSTPMQTEVVQHLFKKVEEQGYISENTIQQLFCDSCSMFLADRFVHGECPHCGYEDARGDQCENCGKLLDPTDLVKPRCGVCSSEPKIRETRHLYLNLPAILPKLQEWMDTASVEGFWARNALQMTKSWIRDGLKERCITRDLKWGIPVPKKGFEDKVFYVWFDAPIGYISIAANHTDEWEQWWKNPDEVDLFQFIGKDNIPFHTVIFPSTLLGSGENWTLLHHMSSSEYLNYENTKFSKSKGIGVFGNDCQDTGIPADVWRFYIYYIRPEKSDAMFTWKDFQEKVNGELIGNLANLVNRTFSFINRFYDGKIPAVTGDSGFWNSVKEKEQSITIHLDRAELRDGLREIFELSSIGNKAFQDGEPWRTRKEDPSKADLLLRDLCYLIRDLAILISPYLPETSGRILSWLGQEEQCWDDLRKQEGLDTIAKPEILFQKLEDDLIDELRSRFSGSQKEREARSVTSDFRKEIDLRVARITIVEKHPDAEKLYIETLDCGNGEERQIVSGLAEHYQPEELQGKNIILVYNLKPAKLRGVKSEGMLLAADNSDENAERKVEVLFVPRGNPGDPVVLETQENAATGAGRIKIDRFFEIPMEVKENQVLCGDVPLVCGDDPVTTRSIARGTVG